MSEEISDYVPCTDRAYYYRARRMLTYHEIPFICIECGSGYDVQVHHIDENIRNNDIGNLMPLCILCHAEIHPDRSGFILGRG